MTSNKQRDPMTGIVYVSKPDKGGDSAPFFKGFVGVSKQMLRVLLEQEEDDYGSIKIDIAVWKKDGQPGVLSGKAQLPYALRKQIEEGGGIVPAPVGRAMPSKKVKEYAADDVDVDDNPF